MGDLLATANDAIKEIELDFSTVHRLFEGLGMKEDVSKLLGAEAAKDPEAVVYCLPDSDAQRAAQLWRLLKVVQLFGRYVGGLGYLVLM